LRGGDRKLLVERILSLKSFSFPSLPEGGKAKTCGTNSGLEKEKNGSTPGFWNWQRRQTLSGTIVFFLKKSSERLKKKQKKTPNDAEDDLKEVGRKKNLGDK